MRGSDDSTAGVAHGGRAGVADEGHTLTALQSLEHLLRGDLFVVSVGRKNVGMDAVTVQ